METLQVEVSWGMGPRFERQGSVRVVRETGVPLAAVGTLEPPKKLPEQLVARQRPYLLYRLHPSQVHVHNHPPMIANSWPLHPHVALDNSASS